MKFKTGDKIVCIDTRNPLNYPKVNDLELYGLYTVEMVLESIFTLKELPDKFYKHIRFMKQSDFIKRDLYKTEEIVIDNKSHITYI